MVRLGLCCIFREAPIKFRTTTVTYAKKLGNNAPAYLDEILQHNLASLRSAIHYCHQHGIGSFRINSQFIPLASHPDFTYSIDDPLQFASCRELAQQLGIRLTFHPDQFVVLNSPRDEVVAQSIAELEYQAELAEAVGADVINIHAGGVYGDKEVALSRFAANFTRLSKRAQQRLTVENDDRSYTPSDLLPLCKQLDIPLVYDVHHHRCHPDDLSIKEATEAALQTWNREPLFHISSAKDLAKPRPHSDYIDRNDWPTCWNAIDPLTVEVEAKAKELAVEKLARDLTHA